MSVGKLTTPTGESTFVKLDTPDTTFGAPGSYTATMKLSKDGQEEVESMLAPAIKKALKQFGGGIKVEDIKLPTFINKEGEFCITGRLKASGKRQDTGEEFENRVKIIDSVEDALPHDTMIGKGSKLKFVGDLVAYDFTSNGKRNIGISFRLKKVQVMKLIEVRTAAPGSPVNF